MAETIDFGQLDQILLKPIDSQFVLTMRYINFTGFYRVILGVLVILIVITKSNMEITLLNLLGYLLLVACGLILIYSIWFITAASLVWFPRLTNLVDLLFSISGISRYPPEIIGNLKHYYLEKVLEICPTLLYQCKQLNFHLQKWEGGSKIGELAIHAWRRRLLDLQILTSC